MTFPRARLVISACMFLGWLCFLFLLVVESPATILSRPQFLLATLWVVGEVREDQSRPNPQVVVETILWSAHAADYKLEGQSIAIPELAGYGPQQGFHGAGKYLFPLIKIKEAAATTNEYSVGAIPFAGNYPHLLPTLGSVELLRTGENPGQVAKSMIQFAKWTKMDAEAALARLEKHPNSYLMVARRLPLRDAYDLKKELTGAGAKVSLKEGAVKIYPLTPQTRSQVEEIIPSNR